MKEKTVKRIVRLKDENKAWRDIFAEISCLSHSFRENIVVRPIWILEKWRRFMFLGFQPIKTYLTLHTSITEWEIHAHIYSLLFRLCKVLFYTYFYRAYCELLELNFGKMREVYLSNIFIYKKIFHILHTYLILIYTKVSLDPKFLEFLEQNAQRKETVSDLDASSSTKSWYQIRIIFFITINP